MRISRVAALALGAGSFFLGILSEAQNATFVIGLAFEIAASVNLLVLFLSMYWHRLITWGAFLGGFLGLFTIVSLMMLGPTLWVTMRRWFPVNIRLRLLWQRRFPGFGFPPQPIVEWAPGLSTGSLPPSMSGPRLDLAHKD